MSIFLTEKRRLTGYLGVLNEKKPTEGIPVGENAVLGGGFGAVCRECRGSANRELGIISQEISADSQFRSAVSPERISCMEEYGC